MYVQHNVPGGEEEASQALRSGHGEARSERVRHVGDVSGWHYCRHGNKVASITTKWMGTSPFSFPS